MLKAKYSLYNLNFKEPSGTSRGVLLQKETWYISIWDDINPNIVGKGECAIFRGLSFEDDPQYEKMLLWVCNNINMLMPYMHKSYLQEENEDQEDEDGILKRNSSFNNYEIQDIKQITEFFNKIKDYSSIIFGVETAIRDLKNGGKGIIFPSDFTLGLGEIEINGLIWMGEKLTMQKRIEDKLKNNFHCIKLKIGAIDFASEIELIKSIRKRYSYHDIELRVDANGAFDPKNALQKLDLLSKYNLHSIEQPIKQGNWKEMSKLCSVTPLAIALDEELIGVNNNSDKIAMLSLIKPQYIILKPALVGGYKGAKEWIKIAQKNKIKWWITSALESNIGLNALAQWTYTLNNPLPQGLGTGALFTNNTYSPLKLIGSKLKFIG